MSVSDWGKIEHYIVATPPPTPWRKCCGGGLAMCFGGWIYFREALKERKSRAKPKIPWYNWYSILKASDIRGRENCVIFSTMLLVAVFMCLFGASFQSQAVDPEQFSNQESNMMLEQKAPVFPQQYASQAQMAQGSYNPMQDPNFHTMGQRPNYTTLRMQPRPGLRPTGLVQNQPNQLRLQLQHRLQAQQVSFSWDLWNWGSGRLMRVGVPVKH